jgi:hypothetical protein
MAVAGLDPGIRPGHPRLAVLVPATARVTGPTTVMTQRRTSTTPLHRSFGAACPLRCRDSHPNGRAAHSVRPPRLGARRRTLAAFRDHAARRGRLGTDRRRGAERDGVTVRLRISNTASLPPLIAQAEYTASGLPRAVALVMGISQGCFAFAPLAFAASPPGRRKRRRGTAGLRRRFRRGSANRRGRRPTAWYAPVRS